MIVAEIIARLQERAGSNFGLIEGAGELAALGNAPPPAMPAAYVYVAEEAAGDNERATGPVLQRVEMDVSVVVIAGNVSDATGAAAAGDVEALKRAVRRALIGWQPPAADDVITLVGARIVRVREGAVWCEMTFAVVTYEQEED